MAKPTEYHKMVARILKASESVGRFYTYEEILAGVMNRFPTEQELKELIAQYEQTVQEATKRPFNFEDFDPRRKMQ